MTTALAICALKKVDRAPVASGPDRHHPDPTGIWRRHQLGVAANQVNDLVFENAYQPGFQHWVCLR